MAKLSIATGIIADEPTNCLTTYPKEVLEKAVKQFNNRTAKNPIKGGVLDLSNIDEIGEATHITRRMFINESGMLCAEIETLDTDAGRELLKKIRGNSRVIARPIMCVPAYIDILKSQPNRKDPLEVTKINSIMRIQIQAECDEAK